MLQPHPSAAANESFNVLDSEDGNYLTIVAYDSSERPPHLIVFEVLKPDRQLRRLYDLKLVNKRLPKWVTVAGSGRFVISIDQWSSGFDTENAIVVYDMIRNEHTSYRLSDIFTKDEVEDRSQGRLAHGWWNGGMNNVNERTQEFYPTSPDYFREFPADQLSPFIVIDLPTRAVRVEKQPIIGNPIPKEPSPRGWKWERGDGNDFDPQKSLPSTLKYNLAKDSWIDYRLVLPDREYKIHARHNSEVGKE
ncbi:MAG: hypothetical protein U0892_14090 [Pirellulales bacterium]